MIEEYTDGWEGFTKSDLKKMYDTCINQWPVWIYVNNGNGFIASESLRANGLHPQKIPTALRDHCIAGELIKKIAEHIELNYIETLD